MISPTEELCWRTRGWVVPTHMLEIEDQLIHDIEHTYKGKEIPDDFGTETKLMFPSVLASINEMAVHKELLAIAGNLLNAPPRLIQMVAWAKKGSNSRDKTSNQDQRMHMDYGNNSFVHPPPFHNPNVCAVIIYLCDTDETGGATRVVSRRGPQDPWYKSPYTRMPGQAGLEFVNNREDAELMMAYEGDDRSSLYDREEAPQFDVGEMLWYRHDVWHRGTPVNAGKIRYVINMAWSKTESPNFIWQGGYAKHLYYGWLEEFIATLNPYQLYSVGFPHPLSSYWCNETIAGVAARYHCYGFDINKYLTASII